ncbi:MAG: ATP-binding protein [Deltaproteobacteria bacterium]|nr:MAG: ATP-binding protein [Deltaproteobacteria bacterium]
MEISSIITQNPWWKHGEDFVSFDNHFKNATEGFIEYKRGDISWKIGNIFIIRGPRQVGKTIWIKQHIASLIRDSKVNPRSISYLSCDTMTAGTRRELGRAIRELIGIMRDFGNSYIFLDEINFVRDWEYEIKALSDQGLLSKVVLLVTGSSPGAIKHKAETLPGRGVSGNEFLLKPLSFREFVLQTSPRIGGHTADQNKKDSLNRLHGVLTDTIGSLDELPKLYKSANIIFPYKEELDDLMGIYMQTGGFPRPINEFLTQKYIPGKGEKMDRRSFEDIVRVVLGDIQRSGKGEGIAKQVLSAISKKLGSRYSYIKLAKSTEEGVKQPTVTDYAEHLADCFILNLLFCIDLQKKEARLKADKKIYFADPFILHSVESWLKGRDAEEVSMEYIQDNTALSRLAELLVCQHLAALREIPIQRETSTFLWFYYDARREIDFIFRNQKENLLGIEVKYQASPSEKDIRKIQGINEYIVLTKDEIRDTEGIMMFPLSVFLALLDKSDRNL